MENASTKKCTKCKKIIPIDEFYKNNKNNAISSKCKICIKLALKEKYATNQEFKNKTLKNSNAYRQKNLQKKRETDKLYQKQPEVIKKRNERSRKKYKKEGVSPERKEYFKKYMSKYIKEYLKRPEVITYYKNYRKKDSHKKARKREYLRNKDKPEYKINRAMSKGIWKSLKNKKNGSWKNHVDYTLEELMKHLEKKFQLGMTWDNYGEWHIDHIQPRCSFTVEEYKKCWALNNLQPLWAEDNMKKGDSIPHDPHTVAITEDLNQ